MAQRRKMLDKQRWLAGPTHTYSLTLKIINDTSTCESYVRINREKPAVINFGSVIRFTLDHIQFWFLSNAKIRYYVALLLSQYLSTLLSEMPIEFDANKVGLASTCWCMSLTGHWKFTAEPECIIWLSVDAKVLIYRFINNVWQMACGWNAIQWQHNNKERGRNEQ